MKQWSLPVVVLFLVFTGMLAYFSFITALNYLRWRAAEDFRNRAYGDDGSRKAPVEGRALLEDIRKKATELGGDDLRLLYLEQLVDHSWNYPDDSVDNLREAITIGQELYRSQDRADEYLIYRLSYAYLAAGLPTKLERWRAEALAQAPASRPYMRYLEFWGRIMQDDLAGARLMIEEELESRSDSGAIRGLALACYSGMGDNETASQYEDALMWDDPSDYYFTRAYANYLMERGDFAGAQEQLLYVVETDTDDPDYAFYLAAAFGGELGLDDPLVSRLVEVSATTTRRDVSIPGAQASVASWLFDCTGDIQWWERLRLLAGKHPDNFHVLLSFAVATLDSAADADALGTVLPNLPPSARLPLDCARDVLALAERSEELQDAHLLMARALLYPRDDLPPAAAMLAESLRHLRIALGDPAEPAAIATQRTPDYEYFQLDDIVIQTRQDYPEYDHAVHRIIIDYLNRRRELFAKIVMVPSLSYRLGADNDEE